MFYSHQLLARKAPLGQIWMAATMHAKMNRKKLSQLNLIAICEEILNPSVPMALRLSGILMGGVVIVYERKVKLLYDDVTRFMVEINDAWKVKTAPDPTVLPKGKSQARKEAVTLPENPLDAYEGAEIEQSLNSRREGPTLRFHHSAYISMRLDSIDDPYIENTEENARQKLHQVDPEDIKIHEQYDSRQSIPDTHNRFERFDVEDDDGVQMNFASQDYNDIPANVIPSPPPRDEVERNARFETDEETKEQEAVKKEKKKRKYKLQMDNEQIIIPGHVYQSWLQNPAEIISNRRNKKVRRNFSSLFKTKELMELPLMVLLDEAFTKNVEIHYSTELAQLGMPIRLSRTSPNRSSQPEFLSDNGVGIGEGSDSIRVEELRAKEGAPKEDVASYVSRPKLYQNSFCTTPLVNPVFPPSFWNGHGTNLEINLGRKRAHSQSGGSLPPVAEDVHSSSSPNIELTILPEDEQTEQDVLVETGPTQSQFLMVNQPVDIINDSIKSNLKAHFSMAGAASKESLNKLTQGMDKPKAAMLFYHICVLATRDVLQVEQNDSYGDIFISKGSKM